MLLFSIITELSLWFLPFCLGLGFLYAWILYRSNDTFESASPVIRKTMWAVRFVSVSIIAFLLLSPFFRSENKIIEKPLLIIARDNSESILFSKDSAFYKDGFQKKLSELKVALNDKFTIKELYFETECTDSAKRLFSGKNTDFSQLFGFVANKYFNYNIGAIIVASDGIATKGATPVFAAESNAIKVPIFTIAMGDTIAYRDIAITSVKYNQIAFEGNEVQIELHLNAQKCKGEVVNCTLMEGSQILTEKRIVISTDEQFLSVPMEIGSLKGGLHHFKINITHVKNEHTYNNNSKEFVVEVIKNKQKILIVYNAPHPDISAIKNALETNKNFEIKVLSAYENIQNIEAYNIVIASQLPSTTNAFTQGLQKIISEGIPVWYVCGTQSDFSKLSVLFPGFITQSRFAGYDECQLSCNKQFPLFELSDEEQTFLEQCPPLATPYATFNTSTADILGFQRISNITTEKPLLAFFNNSESKTALVLGEGLWRWRMAAYRQNQSFDLFDGIIYKTVNYLALNIKKNKFMVKCSPSFSESENISFQAELYNDSYQLINNPEVLLEVKNTKGTSYKYSLARTAKSYGIEIGSLPKGDYSYKAQVLFGNKTYNQSGRFSVLAVNVESENILARHNELYSLSQLNNGKMFYPNEVDKLTELLRNNDNIKPISHFDRAMKDWVDSPWLFVFLLCLITTEWFIRKYNGGY